jgi:hypothetical protein
MARRFFRVQHKGYSFEDMRAFVSGDGGDDLGEEVGGLCVSGSPSGLDGGSRFGGSWDAMSDDDELVVLEGYVLARLYDGYRIEPVREVARFTIAEWKRMLADESAYDYES